MRRPGVRIPLPPAFALRDEKRRLSRRSETKADFQCDLASVPQRLRLGRRAFFTDDHGKRLSDLMKDFYYVYILASETDGETHYTGITHNLTARLSKHNQCACVQTSKNRPWKIEIAIAFRSEAKARRFERYLKTGPGRDLRAVSCESFRVCRSADLAKSTRFTVQHKHGRATTLKELTRRIVIDGLPRRFQFLCDHNHALPKKR